MTVVAFVKPATAVQTAIHDTRHSEFGQMLKREQTLRDLDALLDRVRGGCTTFTMTVVRDDRGIRVDARIGRSVQTLAGPYPQRSINDFAGIVRAAANGWARTLGRRAQMTIVA